MSANASTTQIHEIVEAVLTKMQPLVIEAAEKAAEDILVKRFGSTVLSVVTMRAEMKGINRDVAVLQGRVAAHSEIIALAGLHTVAPPRGDVAPSVAEVDNEVARLRRQLAREQRTTQELRKNLARASYPVPIRGHEMGEG